MLTIPRSSYKSFTKDLTWQTYGIIIQCAFPFKRRRHYFMTLTEAIAVQVILVKVCIVTISMDSDLEAFSHNPTDDSFAALTVQSTALPNIWTNGSSRTKLDYCCNNISSVGMIAINSDKEISNTFQSHIEKFYQTISLNISFKKTKYNTFREHRESYRKYWGTQRAVSTNAYISFK